MSGLPAVPLQKVAVLGAGNLGSALIGGILKAGIAGPNEIVATVRTPEHAALVASRFHIKVLAGNNLEAIEHAGVVILAVKPKVLPAVLEEIRWGLRDDRILISLVAAFPISLIEQIVGRHLSVFRAMPNIPVLVEEGATAIAHNSHVKAAQRDRVESIFRAVGAVLFLEEHHLHAVTALSGSGPAFVYTVIESMIAAGLSVGLPLEASRQLAAQTVLGAAKLVRDSGMHPAVLKDQVTTPGGTTIAGLERLESSGLRAGFMGAVQAATERSREITQHIVEAEQAKE